MVCKASPHPLPKCKRWLAWAAHKCSIAGHKQHISERSAALCVRTHPKRELHKQPANDRPCHDRHAHMPNYHVCHGAVVGGHGLASKTPHALRSLSAAPAIAHLGTPDRQRAWGTHTHTYMISAQACMRRPLSAVPASVPRERKCAATRHTIRSEAENPCRERLLPLRRRQASDIPHGQARALHTPLKLCDPRGRQDLAQAKESRSLLGELAS